MSYQGDHPGSRGGAALLALLALMTLAIVFAGARLTDAAAPAGAGAGQAAPLTPYPYLSYFPLVLHNSPPLTPVATATVTRTPAPTATATATQTPLPGGVFVLPSHGSFVDGLNNLHILGEVFNNTGNTLTTLHVTADVRDGAGQTIATAAGDTLRNILASGDQTCFDIVLPSPAGWATYTFRPVTYATSARAPFRLTIFSDKGAYDAQTHYYKVDGWVRNDERASVQNVRVYGTLYDGTATVIGCAASTVVSFLLDPAQSSSFSMTFDARAYPDALFYRLQSDAGQ